jgi:hypothetical protein
MMYLTATTDKFDIQSSSAALLDLVANGIEAVSAGLTSPASVLNVGASSAAGFTDWMTAPSASNTRTMKQGTVRNKDATLSADVTVYLNRNGTRTEIHKVTLLPGQTLIYIEGVGFFTLIQSVIRSGLRNSSSADQVLGTSADQYITGSTIALPSSTSLPAGTVLRWRVTIGKGAAGTGTFTYKIVFGVNGSSADTARNTFGAFDTETAVADEAIDEVFATIRGPISSACIVEATAKRADNLTTTGFSNTARKAQIRQVQSAAFDITTAGIKVGLTASTTTAVAPTIRQVHAEILIPGT